MARAVPITSAIDDIVPEDKVMMYNDATGNVVIKARNMAQLEAYFSGKGTSLQYTTEVGKATITQAASTNVGVDNQHKTPAATRDALLEVDVETLNSITIDYAALLDLTPIDSQALPAAGLDENNSVAGMIGALIIRVALVNNVAGAADPADTYFGFAFSENGTYVLTLNYIQLALEAFADRNTPTATVPLSRQEREVPDPSTGNENDVVKVNAAGAYVLGAAGGSGGASAELSVRASLPDAAGFSLGDIINFNGDLYELVATTVDANVYRGTVGQPTSGFYGDATFQWQPTSPSNIRLALPKTALGSSPPASLWCVVQTSNGDYALVEMDRASGSDTSDSYAYHRDPQEPGIDINTAGVDFSVAFYTDENRQNARNIHTLNRWEKVNRNEANVNPIALAGNTDRWPVDKLTLPAANSRGRLLATSSVLNTAIITRGHGYGNTWTLETNSGLTTQGENLKEPLTRIEDDQIGFWFVTMVGNAEIQEVLLPGRVALTARSDSLSDRENTEATLNFDTAASKFLVMQQRHNGDWLLISSGYALPANSTVRVYMAVVVSGAGGLSQSQVDARVDALIPPARRIPDFAQGDAGEVVTVNPTGDGLVIRAVPAGARGPAGPTGPTGPAGPPGAGGGSSSELSVLSSTPAVAGYSAGDIINVQGELYELVANTAESNVYRGTSGTPSAGFSGDSTFQWQGALPYNIRVNLSKTALGRTAPASLYIKFTNNASGEVGQIKIDRASASDTATTYRYHRDPQTAALEAATVGDAFTVEFYTDALLTTAQAIHAANRWELDKRDIPVVNPTALAGNNDRWPKAKLPADTVYTADLPVGTMVLNETFLGFQLTTTSADRFAAAPTYFSPPIDLDDHPHGEFHCSLELTIAPTSDVNMGFVQGKSNQTADDRNRALSNIVFASDVAEESAWVASTTLPINGLSLFTQTVYSGNTIVGTYNILLVKNSHNETGAYYYWDGQAGSTGATITAELRVTFTPSDAPAETTISGWTLLGTDSSLGVSSNALVLVSVPAVPRNANLLMFMLELTLNEYRTLIIPAARFFSLTANSVGSTTGSYVVYGFAEDNRHSRFGRRSDDRLLLGDAPLSRLTVYYQ